MKKLSIFLFMLTLFSFFGGNAFANDSIAPVPEEDGREPLMMRCDRGGRGTCCVPHSWRGCEPSTLKCCD